MAVVSTTRKIAYSPTRTTTVVIGNSSRFEEEFHSFEEYLQNLGIRDKVIIGRFDPFGGVFDFRITSVVSKELVLQIAKHFIGRDFLFEEDWSEIWAIRFLEEETQLRCAIH